MVMPRIKFIKNHKQYKEGEVATLSPNEAFGLIDSGVAIVSKDMTTSDYTTAQVISPQVKIESKLPKYKRK